MFNDRGVFRRTEIHKLLEQLKFDVRGLSVRWLGWREDKNGRLVRVTHTDKRQVQFKRGQNGQLVTVNKPERLRYLGVHSINNGLTYNLISKNAASTEAAGRIMAVAEVTGNAFATTTPNGRMRPRNTSLPASSCFARLKAPGQRMQRE